jgi:catechol 2,3-dioxygenase-like lactoylglutathione lyase family enzyme
MGEETSKLKLPPIEQIGIVVKDLDAAVDYYTNTLGWGPFGFFELDLKDFIYRGRACNARIRVALSSYDPVQIELIEVLEGETPHSVFLREKGEGIQHLCCRGVDDLDSVLARLARVGIEPVFQGHLPEFGVRAAYVVGEKTNGVTLELYEFRGV